MRLLCVKGLCVLAGVFLAMIFPPFDLGQSHSLFPVDIYTSSAPRAVMADGRLHLLYELRLINFASLPIEIKAIDVFGDGTTALASYHGQELEKAVIPVELLSSADSPSEAIGTRSIREGHAAIIFFDLTLDSSVRPPGTLRHRFSFSVTRNNGEVIERIVDGVVVKVIQQPPPVLHAPLSGPGWVALNALGAKDHRRSLNAFDGRERIPQRFAIDWMRIGADGRLCHGSTDSNANFYDYGAEVLAVADGSVVGLMDGLPDNMGSTERSARNITLDNVLGNYLFQDIGHGRFALYAHLKPGSLRVKSGERVKAGQVLALVGNSGNSDAPHLHFHLVDAASPLGAEGIPYELETFTQLGVIPDDPDMQYNVRVLPTKTQAKPVVHEREFPGNNAVVNFPSRASTPGRRIIKSDNSSDRSH